MMGAMLLETDGQPVESNEKCRGLNLRRRRRSDHTRTKLGSARGVVSCQITHKEETRQADVGLGGESWSLKRRWQSLRPSTSS